MNRRLKRTRRRQNKEKRVTLSDIKDQASRIIDYALFNGDVLITRYGKIVAKLSSYSEKQYLEDITKKVDEATKGMFKDE